MKKYTLHLLAFISVFSLFSCTKTTSAPAPAATNPITGSWAGLYQIDDAAYLGNFYYRLDIFADSTVIQTGGSSGGYFYTSKGTWSLTSDSLFAATVVTTDPAEAGGSSATQHIKATYHKTGILTNGTWVNDSGVGSHATGTFTSERLQ